MEKSRMNLPKGPDTLCFDKDEFMKEDFDVDHFMSDCQKRVQLEALRDDLELYYKLLKTAMVELINKDYADFVNLSTNLICVLWLIQVIPSVEKIEKILNSQHSKETSALEASSEKGSTVPGYDFLVNSVWPEIVRELEEKLPLIFNSGNPDAFHQLSWERGCRCSGICGWRLQDTFKHPSMHRTATQQRPTAKAIWLQICSMEWKW
ncbi:conserved oligomeric Golgi complex subunit 2-like isoform 3-T3 [Dama dama]|uniref:conserved oligomeric Golgi complex subunit 2-like isoform X3 n=1 Tax=Dama dama TaxID=30532 RepID=UPI002A35A713|nr:conserved oligomeric Golgi complex subunit 2-like isoform X3 [Dama dama]